MQIAPELLDLIYGAALDGALWPRLLEDLSDAFHGGSTALIFQNQISKDGSGVSARMAPEAVASFYDYYAARNPLTARNDLGRLYANRSRLPINVDEDIIEKRAFMRTEFYADFQRPHGLHNALMITIGLSGPSAATLNIGRTPAHAQFAQDDFALGRALQPHLARAFLVAMELGRARQTSEALLSVLERSPRGLFLLGEDGRIRHANRAAEGLLGDGLTVTNGELSASASDGARRLKQAIAKALTADGARHGQSLSIRRPSLRRPLSVVVVPVAARGDLPFAAQGPGALVCIADPEAGIVLPAEGLRELFGFTAAEAAVALELLAGYDTKTVARRLALSVHTVRVHLSRIMSKTHTGRQAELMRLLMSIMGVL